MVRKEMMGMSEGLEKSEPSEFTSAFKMPKSSRKLRGISR
jgi:hypothetical protein